MKNVLPIIFSLVTLICLFNPKIRVIKIISGHFSTFKNDNKNRISPYDYITFLIAPLIAAILITFKFKIMIKDISVLLTVFSIFAALLFNFLMLIIQAKDNAILKEQNSKYEFDKDKYMQCINQTYYNVSFANLLSVFIIILLWITSMLTCTEGILYEIIITIIWFSMIMFFLDLIMILKRIFAIYNIDEN